MQQLSEIKVFTTALHSPKQTEEWWLQVQTIFP